MLQLTANTYNSPRKLDSKHEECLRSAELAFAAWSSLTVAARRRFVQNLRRVIVEKQEEIIRTIALETGKPVTEVASQEVTAALEMLKFSERAYPRWLKERRFRYWRPGFWTKRSSIHFEPMGVLVVIGPSTYPFSLPLMQAVAALLCGNCVIIKPSERCPQMAALIRRIFKEAEWPDGVVEIIEGGGEVVEQLISSEIARKVIFTGSYRTGKLVAEMCGRYFKPCILELGGNGAAIVCEDADLELAARGIAWSAFYANGLSCIGTKRVFVHASVAQKFIPKLLKEIERIRSGDPLDPFTDVGKIKNGDILLNLRGLVREALANGSRLWTAATGDTRDPSRLDFEKPMVLLDDSFSSHAISAAPSQSDLEVETGGPLLTVRQVTSLDQAVREVNASSFGLGASVWSRGFKKARVVARQLHVGLVWINDSSVGQPQFPWGGVKHSGWGRLFSQAAVSELTNVKVISCDHRRTSLRKLWWFPYSSEKLEIFMAVNELVYGPKRLSVLGRCTVKMWRFVRHLKRQF
ncbi:MAG: aldehyde dehydrogenase family protein [Acidobacteria bacterium]|nr:aldehyde dehydrogenase family protein [Acidobacteriota bacterium]